METKLIDIKQQYYIISKNHMTTKDFAILFWGKNFSGYQYNLDRSGIYSQTEIDTNFNCHESNSIAVKKEIIDSIKEQYVIDNNELGFIVLNNSKNRKLLNIRKKELRTVEFSLWDERVFISPDRFLVRNKHTLRLIDEIKSIM